MIDDEDFSTEPGTAPADERARDGYLWVNPNTHEILGVGIGARPEGVANAKLRRYFDDLDRGIEHFGDFGADAFGKSEVRRVCAEMEDILGLPFKECFYVCRDSGDKSSFYLAVVFRTHRGGSVWALKNRIETTRQVAGSSRLEDNDKIFRVELPGFTDGGGGSPGSKSSALYCPKSNLQLPLTGLCEENVPGCTVCGATGSISS